MKKAAILGFGLIGFGYIFWYGLIDAYVSVEQERGIKNHLAWRIKECKRSDFINGTTKFSDIGVYKTDFYKVEPLKDDSCFNAKAIPLTNHGTWYSIDFDATSGTLSKKCGDTKRKACNEGNIWEEVPFR